MDGGLNPASECLLGKLVLTESQIMEQDALVPEPYDIMKFLFFYSKKVFDDVPILLNYPFDEEDDVFFFFFHVLGVTDNILLRNANFHAISRGSI